MANLDSILKSRDVTLPTKVPLVKAMVFPVVMDRCESWTMKKAEHRRIDAFKLWCWRTLFRVPWTARKTNQSILKEINPEYSLEGLILKLKLQAETPFGHLMRRADSGKNSDAGQDWRQKEKGTTEDEMVRWHHWLNEHEFEQTFTYGNSSTKDTEENGAVLEPACCFIRIKSALIWTRFLAWVARWTILCRKWGGWGEAAYWVGGGFLCMLHLRGFIKYSCGNSSQTSVVFKVEGFKPSVQWNSERNVPEKEKRTEASFTNWSGVTS